MANEIPKSIGERPRNKITGEPCKRTLRRLCKRSKLWLMVYDLNMLMSIISEKKVKVGFDTDEIHEIYPANPTSRTKLAKVNKPPKRTTGSNKRSNLRQAGRQQDITNVLQTLQKQYPSDKPANFLLRHYSQSPSSNKNTMAPPSALNIATQSVNRLVKEESYYHKEQTSQEARIKKLQDEIAANSPELDSNAPYVLKQEVRFLRSPFPPTLKHRA